MKHTARDLAKSLLKIIRENPDKASSAVSRFLEFCKARHLAYLLPNIVNCFEKEVENIKKDETLKIFARFKPSDQILKNIKEMAGANADVDVEITEDKDIIGGFVALYKNKVIDASLKNNLKLLKNKLINA